MISISNRSYLFGTQKKRKRLRRDYKFYLCIYVCAHIVNTATVKGDVLAHMKIWMERFLEDNQIYIAECS